MGYHLVGLVVLLLIQEVEAFNPELQRAHPGEVKGLEQRQIQNSGPRTAHRIALRRTLRAGRRAEYRSIKPLIHIPRTIIRITVLICPADSVVPRVNGEWRSGLQR